MITKIKKLVYLLTLLVAFSCNKTLVDESLTDNEKLSQINNKNYLSDSKLEFLLKINAYNEFKRNNNIKDDKIASVKFLELVNSKNFTPDKSMNIASSLPCTDYETMNPEGFLSKNISKGSQIIYYTGNRPYLENLICKNNLI